jgi:nitrile hydratase
MTHEHDHDHSHDHGHAHDHSHSHGASHDHAPRRDHDAGPMGAYELLEATLRSLLVEKGVLSEREIAGQIDLMDSRSPALGGKIVARAWTDPDYKSRLLADARAASAELGLDIGSLAELQVVENTPAVHNLVTCTLCSCYPRLLLGIPPAWYKSLAYRSRSVRDPRGVLAEFGLHPAAGQEVRVHDSTADLRYLVLPMRPRGTEGWDEAALAALVTRDSLIGTAVPTVAGAGPGPGGEVAAA